MPLKEIKNRLVNITGVLAISHTTLANFLEIIFGINWNVVSLAITTFLSAVYLGYRIHEARKAGLLRELEIQKQKIEIELMQKWEQENVRSISRRRINSQSPKNK